MPSKTRITIFKHRSKNCNILKTNEIKEFSKNIIDFLPVINPSKNNVEYVRVTLKDITHIDIDVSKERELIKGPDKNNNKGFYL